ncbi:MAG: hypothetical protein AAF724_02450 [Pseudomonadota bacterium]
MDDLRQKTIDALIYTPASLIVFIWALVSFFPFVTAGMTWNSWWVLAHIGFLAAGFPGLGGLYLFISWAGVPSVESERRVRFRRLMPWLGVYALVWMVAYFLFIDWTL